MIVESIEICYGRSYGLPSPTSYPWLETLESLADAPPAMRCLLEKPYTWTQVCFPAAFTHNFFYWKLSEQIHSPSQSVPRVGRDERMMVHKVDMGRLIQGDSL